MPKGFGTIENKLRRHHIISHFSILGQGSENYSFTYALVPKEILAVLPWTGMQ